MNRRVLVCTIAGMLAFPAIALAQPAIRRPPKRVAICLPFAKPADKPDEIRARRQGFVKEFAKHGVIDGRDIEIVIVWGEGAPNPGLWAAGLMAAVRQAVALRADVILAQTDEPKYLLPVTRDVPLVLWGVDSGLEDSIEMANRRGENVTGALYSYIHLVLKRFEIMKALRPGAGRAAQLLPESSSAPTEQSEMSRRRAKAVFVEGARKLGLEFIHVVLPRNVSGEEAVRALRDARVDLAEVFWGFESNLWGALAAGGIAASGILAAAEEGALLSGWTVGWVDSAVRLAAKVVRGERAAAIPVERAMRFGLAINLRTARTLGITVPPSVLLQADRVIE